MKDLIEFFNTIGERLKNRIFGPYLLSFLFWNWKPLLLIYASDRSIENVIRCISERGYFSLENVVLIPLGISISFSIIIPFLSLGLGALVVWPQGKIIKTSYVLIKKRREGDLQIAGLDHDIGVAKAGNLKLLDLNSKIEALQKSNEQYINENDELRKEVTGLTYESSDRGLWELKNAKEASDRAVEKLNETFNEIVGSLLILVNSELQKGNFQLSNVPDSIVKSLMDHGFIVSHLINSRSYYKFTQAGRNRHFALKSVKDDEQQDTRA